MKKAIEIIDEEDFVVDGWIRDDGTYKMVAIQSFIECWLDRKHKKQDTVNVIINDKPQNFVQWTGNSRNRLVYVSEDVPYLDLGFGNDIDNVNNFHAFIDMRLVDPCVPYIVTAMGTVTAGGQKDMSIVSGKAAVNSIVKNHVHNINERYIASAVKRTHFHIRNRWSHTHDLNQAVFYVESFRYAPAWPLFITE
jgi:hypothetical protein